MLVMPARRAAGTTLNELFVLFAKVGEGVWTPPPPRGQGGDSRWRQPDMNASSAFG